MGVFLRRGCAIIVLLGGDIVWMAIIANCYLSEGVHLSRRKMKVDYWQEAPVQREQLVLIPTALEAIIPNDHPVWLVDEILDQLDSRRFIPACWSRSFCLR